MGRQVSAEVAGAAEDQLTVRTFKRVVRLVGVQAVSPEMPRQRSLPGEHPATLGTRVLPILLVAMAAHRQRERLPLDLVRLLVPLQRLFEGELPSALRARERLLARVDAPVGFQQRLESEHLPAV